MNGFFLIPEFSKIFLLKFFGFNKILLPYSSFVDFTEFLTTISVILRGTQVQKTMWVFHLFDENDDGAIEMKEMEKILQGCNKAMDSSQVARIFDEMDENKDGKVDMNEFTAGCRRDDSLLKNIGIC